MSNLKPGRKHDVLIAEKVMGLEVHYSRITETYYGEKKEYSLPYVEGYALKHYSTDIAAAWEVVEKLRLRGCFVCISQDENYPDIWVCEIGDAEATSSIASHAICLAALKAVEE